MNIFVWDRFSSAMVVPLPCWCHVKPRLLFWLLSLTDPYQQIILYSMVVMNYSRSALLLRLVFFFFFFFLKTVLISFRNQLEFYSIFSLPQKKRTHWETPKSLHFVSALIHFGLDLNLSKTLPCFCVETPRSWSWLGLNPWKSCSCISVDIFDRYFI